MGRRAMRPRAVPDRASITAHAWEAFGRRPSERARVATTARHPKPFTIPAVRNTCRDRLRRVERGHSTPVATPVQNSKCAHVNAGSSSKTSRNGALPIDDRTRRTKRQTKAKLSKAKPVTREAGDMATPRSGSGASAGYLLAVARTNFVYATLNRRARRCCPEN